jgi:hypothetical protein
MVEAVEHFLDILALQVRLAGEPPAYFSGRMRWLTTCILLSPASSVIAIAATPYAKHSSVFIAFPPHM